MKENIIKYINELEGFKTFIKNAHWAAKNMSTHKLYDDIASSVSDVQDMVSEISQGLFGTIQKGELKPIACENCGEQEFLTKLLNSSKEFYSSIKEGDDYIGLRSEMETFIGKISQFKYLMNLCLKENKALQEIHNIIQEEINLVKSCQNHKTIYISESAKKRLFTESAKMDKERGKNARTFRMALSRALNDGSYEYDESTNTILIDGFSYEIGKKYAESNDGEPIPLHYTFNTVMRDVKAALGDDIENRYSLNDEPENFMGNDDLSYNIQ